MTDSIIGNSSRAGVEQDKDAVDAWTLVHFGFGVVMGKTGLPLLPTVILLAFYEYIENAYDGAVTKAVFGSTRPESSKNILVDVLIGIAGYYVGRAL